MSTKSRKFGSNEFKEYLEITDKENIRQYRIDHCGEPKRQFDKYTGYPKRVRWYCKQIHDCPKCLARRVDDEGDPLFDYIDNGGELYKTVFFNDGRAADFAKRVGGKNYNRYPQEDGSIVFLHPSEYSLADSEPFDFASITKDELTKLIKTPAGKRISGSLARKKEVSRGEESGEIVQLDFGVYDIPDTSQEVADDAMEKVPPIQLPQTVDKDHLQKAIDIAEKALESTVYNLLGVKPKKIHSITKKVAINKIKWPLAEEITSIEQVNPIHTSKIDSTWTYYGEPDWPKKPPDLR